MDAFTHFVLFEEIRKNNYSLESLLNKYVEDPNFVLYTSLAADYDNFWHFFNPEKKDIHFLNFHKRKIDYLSDFSLGLALHGEDIIIENVPLKGVDYYTHKKNGYVDQLRPEVNDILKKYKLTKCKEFDHGLIELATGYYLSKKYPDLKEKYYNLNKQSSKLFEKFVTYLQPMEYAVFKLFKRLVLYIDKQYAKFLTDPISVANKMYALGAKRFLLLFNSLKINHKTYKRMSNAFDKIYSVVADYLESKNSYYSKIVKELSNLNYYSVLENRTKVPIYLGF